jgi:hypothetical protein
MGRPPHRWDGGTRVPEDSGKGRLWLIAATAAVLGLVAADAFITTSLLERITAIRTLDAEQGAARPAEGSRERSIMLLPGALDAKWYLIHAEEFLRSDTWKIRRTGLDNTPQGREVHWSSLIVWLLGAGASLTAAFTEASPTESVQSVAFYFGPVTKMLALALLAWLVWRRFGAGTAALALILLAASASFANMFQAGQVDHHGLAAALCLASVFCLGASSGGVVMRGQSPDHWWPAASGVLAGLAMWVSSATALPVIAACGPAWILSILAIRPGQGVRVWSAAPWRWAVAGAATSLALYALEYFPGDMGWRLEVNHPLYATAWLGAGWLLARGLRALASRRGWETEAPETPRGGWTTGIAAFLAVGAPAVVIALARDRVFLVSDPFVFALHEQYIREFVPLWRTLGEPDAAVKLIDLAWWPIFFGMLASLILWRRKELPAWVPAALILPVVPTLVAQAEAILQVRWTGLSTALWIGCILIAAGLAMEFRNELAWKRWTKLALGIWVVLGVLPSAVAAVRGIAALDGEEGNYFPKAMVPSLLLRDVAHRLIRTDSARVPHVLSDPTSSTELAFYGGVPVVGTLYWENAEGLKRTAAIFSAATESEALSLLSKAGITHIVLPTWDTFADMDAYGRLLASGEEPREGPPPYLARVLSGGEQPDWVRPIHYQIPEVFGVENCRVDIVEIVPGQAPFEARRARGIFEFERGDYPAAIRSFEEALQLDPHAPELEAWMEALRRKLQAHPRPTAPES